MNFKIIIAEDELPILNNIVRKLNSLNLPIEILGAVTNAEDALDIFEHSVPHILLTDIRMPGMSGLELCQIVEERYPQTKRMILTGYDDFQYAQQAIRVRVSDYLLKPVSIKQLRKSMESVCDILEKENEALQHRTLLMGISGQSDTERLPYSFDGKPLGVFLICIGNLLNQTASREQIAYFSELWEQIALENFFSSNNTYAGHQFWILPEKSPNKRFVITSFFSQALPNALLAYIKEHSEDTLSVNLCTHSSGIVYQDIWKTAQMERAFLRSSLIPCHSSVHVADTGGIPPFNTDDSMIQHVLKEIQNRQRKAFLSALHTYLQSLYKLPATQDFLENALNVITKTLKQQNTLLPDDIFSRACTAILETFNLQTDYDTLYQQLYTQLSDLFTAAFNNILDGEGLSQAVKKYIDENYREPISMTSLEEIFHFSDSYIGRVFRKTYGTPPMKYLSSIRIEKAKELLQENPALNIRIAGEMVGYDDQRYFSRIFRNITGLTPSEYKNKLL